MASCFWTTDIFFSFKWVYREAAISMLGEHTHHWATHETVWDALTNLPIRSPWSWSCREPPGRWHPTVCWCTGLVSAEPLGSSYVQHYRSPSWTRLLLLPPGRISADTDNFRRPRKPLVLRSFRQIYSEQIILKHKLGHSQFSRVPLKSKKKKEKKACLKTENDGQLYEFNPSCF